MQSFTVHLSNQGSEHARPTLEAAEKAVFIQDGFSFPAFVFGGFWLAYKRQWLALCFFLILFAALTGLGYWLGLDPMAVSGLSMLLNLFVGVEGHDIQRRTLERHKKPAVAVVTAHKLEDAEAKFFSSLPVRSASPAGTGVLPAWPQTNEVIGMFPMPGGRS